MIENERYGHEGAYQLRGELRDRWYHGNLNKDEVSVNLRLDWELASDSDAETTKDIANLMLIQLKVDLEDIIVNADTIRTEDPLLKVWDGEKKRGQKAVEFVVLAAHLEKQYFEKKESTEYTLYIRPYVRYENDDSPLAVGNQKADTTVA